MGRNEDYRKKIIEGFDILRIIRYKFSVLPRYIYADISHTKKLVSQIVEKFH